MSRVVIRRRFCGPPESGNGGYVCGLLADHIGPSAEVTLRRPPPLETPLQVVTSGGAVELRDGEVVVAQGRPVELDVGNVPRVDFAAARRAASRPVVAVEDHLLPMCFVCGPARADGDGLRLCAGPVDRSQPVGSRHCAVPWIPYDNLAAPDGLVGGAFVWAALDCPTGFALSAAQQGAEAGGPIDILLGRLAVRVDGRPRPGEHCVIVSWPTGQDRRKHFADAALLGETGAVLAVARSTWIQVERQIQLGTA